MRKWEIKESERPLNKYERAFYVFEINKKKRRYGGECYSFEDKIEAEKYAAKRRLQDATRELELQARRDKKKELRKNIVNPYKVGELLYNSWGYDQTNIDYYQITAVKGRTVTIRPIASKIVPGSEGFMSERVCPSRDNFTGPEETKTLQMYGDGTPYIPVRHGCMSYTDEWETKYASHYA